MASVIIVLLVQLGVEARINEDITFICIVGAIICIGNIHIKVSWACAFFLLKQSYVYRRL